MDKALFQQLNQIYAPLRGRANRLARALAEGGLKAEWGWYANHAVKIDGEYQGEEFPIPVMDVEDSALLAAVEDCRRWKNEGKP